MERFILVAKDTGDDYPIMTWELRNKQLALKRFQELPSTDWVELYEVQKDGMKLIDATRFHIYDQPN